MYSILSSHGVFLATAIAVSGAAIFLALLRREKNFPPTQISSGNQLIHPHHPTKQILRSCLSSDEKRRERKKKRVQFADSVKDGEELRKEKKRKSKRSWWTENPEIHGIPGNRVALYNGILRDRVPRMECSY
ncbi:uncharacterized protein LOC132287210 [Cornus florida]|uniref:uncharacterized protein LOC132287210 n=1 Tax=Cornus florida TaxID=4283 RepID=UPI0028A1CFDC|nr:uncharacterized protein LOC132287210 [Cornus florida]